MTMKEKLIATINEKKARSAWDKGVMLYALDMVEGLDAPEVAKLDIIAKTPCLYYEPLKKLFLNGAKNWKEYSGTGGGLVYYSDIAGRLCTPSELKRNDYGSKAPNSHESWYDVEARALAQAFNLIFRCFKEVANNA